MEQQTEALFQRWGPGRTSQGGGGGHTGPWRTVKPANQLPQRTSQSGAPFYSLLGEAFLDAQAVLFALDSNCIYTFLLRLPLIEGLPCACTVLGGLCTHEPIQSSNPPCRGCYSSHFIAKETEAQSEGPAHDFMNKPWRKQDLKPDCLARKCTFSITLFYLH